MSLLDHYQPRDGHFLVFRVRQGCGGLGDRIVGLISAFVWAVLTGRHFRIEWDTPFPLDSVWAPASPRIPWNLCDYAGHSLREVWLIDRIPAMRQFFLEQDLLRDPDSLAVSANQHFFGYLLNNPHLADAVRLGGFTEPAALCREALWTLFRPTAELVEAYHSFAPALRSPNSVGLQIRTLWNWMDGGGHLQPEDLRQFFDCASGLFMSRQGNLVFVSADDPAIIEQTKVHFSNVPVVALPHRIRHVDRSEWESLEDYRATFINLYLLAECRHLVISHWSNFGRIAAFLADKPVWITRKTAGSPACPTVRQPFRLAGLEELLSKEEHIPSIQPKKGAQACLASAF